MEMITIYVDHAKLTCNISRSCIFVVYNYFWTKGIFVHMHASIDGRHTLF
jgi:hypothetical protein